MHTPTGKNLLGFMLSLNAAALWGLLPIAIKEIVITMDPFTLVWYRFVLALFVLFVYLFYQRRLPVFGSLSRKSILLLITAGVGLCINYLLFALSLNYVNAETAEALIQLTTLFLFLGGVIVYREPFFLVQKFGALLIVIGMVLFFNDRFAELLGGESDLLLGVVILIMASLAWVIYALLQKYLLTTFDSVQILFIVYLVSTLLLLPLIGASSLFTLTPLQLGLLLFCCLNTVLAYGSFAEALVHWHASKVSAVLALAPIFTIVGLKLVVWLIPGYEYTDHLNFLSVIAALILVLGSVTVALVPLYVNRGDV